MRSVGTRSGRVFIAVVSLIVFAFAYAGAQSSHAGQGSALVEARERSPRAGVVETEIARSGLVTRLEAALGDEFGGVWFDPATAEVHVGVTSPSSRSAAEAVAAQEGLSENVAETSVRWTWEQLTDAQEGWDRRLGGLFESGRATTSLAADRNAVLVEVGASTSATRLAALEHEAASTTVSTVVEVLPDSRIHFAPWVNRCVKFKSLEANCDPTIVSGASIEDETVGVGDCTAGPPLIKTKRAQKAVATETFLLTAGHCIKLGGGAGKKWYARKKNGERKEIGPAVDLLNKEPTVGVDAGVIKIETSTWAEGTKASPVIPSIANWSEANESEPFPIIKQQPPVEGMSVCFSGQRSGLQCGEVIKTGKTEQSKDEKGNVVEERKEIAEIKLKTGKGGEGDSGAPTFAESAYKTNSEGYVEGIVVGGGAKESEFIYYQPLAFILKELKARKSLEYDLLTKSIENRHGKAKATQYPVTIHGATSGIERFTSEAGAVECESSSYDAVVSEETSTVTVTPEYSKCKASFLGTEATINMEGCTYVFHAGGKVATDSYLAVTDISCPEGHSIKITAATCKLEMKAQTGLESVDLVDDTEASPKKDITVQPTITGMAYTVTQDGIFCPFNGTGNKTDGGYTNTQGITVTGQNPSNSSEKIGFEIGDE